MNEPMSAGLLCTEDIDDGGQRVLERWKVVSGHVEMVEKFRQRYGGEIRRRPDTSSLSLLLGSETRAGGGCRSAEPDERCVTASTAPGCSTGACAIFRCCLLPQASTAERR